MQSRIHLQLTAIERNNQYTKIVYSQQDQTLINITHIWDMKFLYENRLAPKVNFEVCLFTLVFDIPQSMLLTNDIWS